LIPAKGEQAIDMFRSYPVFGKWERPTLFPEAPFRTNNQAGAHGRAACLLQ